MGEAMIVHLIR